MQVKALAKPALLSTFLLAVVLLGCGGSSHSDTTAAGGETTQAPLEKLRRAAGRVKRERREKESAAQESGPSGASRASAPSPTPRNTHHDSGGGAAQFRQAGGDNSIQEFGREEAPAERERAAAVLHAFLDARAAGRWSDACFYLSAGAVAVLEQVAKQDPEQKLEGCAEILDALSSGATQAVLDEAARVDVASLRRDGDRAFLIYRNSQGEPYAISVVEEGDAWKIAGLEGSPLP